MRALRIVWVLVALCCAVTACGDDDGDSASSSNDSTSNDSTTGTSSESRSDVVHTFEEQEFTCEEALDINIGCSDEIVAIWEEWGDNLPDFVSSGQLGPLNDESYRAVDVAFAGVMACVVSEGGGDEQDFIDIMHDPENRTGFEDLAGTELLPAWFEAGTSLCPDLSGGDGYVIP